MATTTNPYDTTPIPGVSNYAGAVNLAKKAYSNALARVGKTRSDLLTAGGYKADFDQNSGQMNNLRVDTSSMYGGLQQMLRGQAQADEQARFAAQDRGLKGGLANQMETDLKYQHGAESANFGQNLIGNLGQTTDDLMQARQAYDESMYQAQLDQAREAIANQMFNAANTDSGAVDTSGGFTDTGTTDSGAVDYGDPWFFDTAAKVAGGYGGYVPAPSPVIGTDGPQTITIKPPAKKKKPSTGGWTQVR